MSVAFINIFICQRKGLFNQNSYSLIGQLNCQTLNSIAAKKKQTLVASKYNMSICAI